jgi:hypothetical protein
MKRFLILLILIVFVTVSCAGQKKWTKPDFHQDEFDKDREECLQAVKNDPQAALTFEECLAKKGYDPEPEPSSDKGKTKAVEIAKTVGKGLLVTALVAVAVAAAAAYVVLWALAGGH